MHSTPEMCTLMKFYFVLVMSAGKKAKPKYGNFYISLLSFLLSFVFRPCRSVERKRPIAIVSTMQSLYTVSADRPNYNIK